MKCPVCSTNATVHHKDGLVLFLTCGHRAMPNPHPGHDRVWRGFLDDDRIELNLIEFDFVPFGDMKTAYDWRPYWDHCPVCDVVMVEVGRAFKTDEMKIFLACGHEWIRKWQT